MIIPAAMFIEAAVDMLKDGAVPEDHKAAQIKELQFALGNHDPNFAQGYELGLQTMRILVMGTPEPKSL